MEADTPRGKVCSTCKRWKPLAEFNLRSASRDGHQWACRQCNSDYHRRHKERHNKQIHARNRRLLAESRRRLWAYLSTHPCVDCGECDPVVLEFDHLRDKYKDIAKLIRGWPWPTVMAEIEKCEVVCANCHRRRTYARQNSWRISGPSAPDTLFDE